MPLEDIDPIYYERTYWLAPADESAAKAYQLLLAAMEERQRVGIGSVVMRNKQYLTAIRPLDGVLAMSTMRFADEVVPQSKVDELPSRRSKPDPKSVKLATADRGLPHRGLGSGEVRGHLHEGAPQAHQAQGQGRGDRRRGEDRAEGQGDRPDGGTRSKRLGGEVRARKPKSAARTKRSGEATVSPEDHGQEACPQVRVTSAVEGFDVDELAEALDRGGASRRHVLARPSVDGRVVLQRLPGDRDLVHLVGAVDES